MKSFINSTNQKLVLLLSVMTVLLCACKRDVAPPSIVDVDEVMLTATAQRLSDPKQESAASRISAGKSDFVQSDAIGLYTQRKSLSDVNSTEMLKSNVVYHYATPVWSPESIEGKLQYSDEPLYVFGYYPHHTMPNASTTLGADPLTVNYALPADQTTADKLIMGDLLWVGAKNNADAGYVRSSEPINLIFSHKLTKVVFKIRLTDSKPEINNGTTAQVQSITVMGKQIHLSAALDVRSGDISTVVKSTEDVVTWSAAGEGVPPIALTVDAPAVHITDMILIPFEAAFRDNMFKYNLLLEGASEGKDFVSYIPMYDSSAAEGSGGLLNFASNALIQITVTIDISKNYADITASSIEPWGPGAIVELPAERD